MSVGAAGRASARVRGTGEARARRAAPGVPFVLVRDSQETSRGPRGGRRAVPARGREAIRRHGDSCEAGAGGRTSARVRGLAKGEASGHGRPLRTCTRLRLCRPDARAWHAVMSRDPIKPALSELCARAASLEVCIRSSDHPAERCALYHACSPFCALPASQCTLCDGVCGQ